MYNDLIFQLHSPEEFRYLSSLGHWIVGYIFLAIVIIVFLQQLGILASKKFLWPGVLVLAGLIFIPFNFLHHGIDQLPLVWKVMTLDPQQRQHMIMFFLLFIAGVVELLLAVNKIKNKEWYFVFPAILLTIGLMFIFHPQHGTEEALAYSIPYHRVLGTIIVLAGVSKGSVFILKHKQKILTYIWITMLLITSIILITYNEPAGSYIRSLPTQNQIPNQH